MTDGKLLINEFINFACKNGANFYSLPPNEKQCILKKINWQVTESYDFGNDRVIPMKAGETLNWKLEIIQWLKIKWQQKSSLMF